MRQAEGQQERHDRDERKIGEPRRVGRNERRHGIEHQKDSERCRARLQAVRVVSSAEPGFVVVRSLQLEKNN